MKNNYDWPMVSLVLTTYNGSFGIERILRSVKKLTYPKNKLEIIVSDNGSTDNSVELAKKIC